jgi:hypothetical protein
MQPRAGVPTKYDDNAMTWTNHTQGVDHDQVGGTILYRALCFEIGFHTIL